jgi:WD40 repeat protein
MLLDNSGVHRRAIELTTLLEKLSQRPDIRNSSPFSKFIDLNDPSDVAPGHELVRCRVQLETRFGVTGLSTYSDALVVVHADTTSLSRLGKVWSIVESDELGSVSIWTIARGRADPTSTDPSLPIPLGVRVFSQILSQKPNSFCLTSTVQIVIGLSTGHVQLFDIREPGKPVMDVPVHGVSPVVALAPHGSHSIVSVGLDDAIRITDLQTKQVVGGGKLTKRLESGETFTCLQIASSRAFIGTSKGRVFIYDLELTSLTFVHRLTLNSAPIRAISVNSDRLLVTHDCSFSIFELSSGLFNRVTTLVSTLKSIQIRSAIFIPNSSCIAAGLADGTVAIYHTDANPPVLIYARYFSEDKINVLHYSESDRVLWAGADDGRIVEVGIPAGLVQDIQYVTNGTVDEVKESVQVTVEPVPTLVVNSAKCCLDENDDDDEWKKDIFRDK